MFISELYNKTDSMTETELLRPYDVVRWLVATHTVNPWSDSVEKSECHAHIFQDWRPLDDTDEWE